MPDQGYGTVSVAGAHLHNHAPQAGDGIAHAAGRAVHLIGIAVGATVSREIESPDAEAGVVHCIGPGPAIEWVEDGEVRAKGRSVYVDHIARNRERLPRPLLLQCNRRLA